MKKLQLNSALEKEIKELGYQIHSHNHMSNMYVNPESCIYLTIMINAENDYVPQAILNSRYKMVKLEIGPIQFPHLNFKFFENQLIECLNESY